MKKEQKNARMRLALSLLEVVESGMAVYKIDQVMMSKLLTENNSNVQQSSVIDAVYTDVDDEE